jgi:hypothetical protein
MEMPFQRCFEVSLKWVKQKIEIIREHEINYDD